MVEYFLPNVIEYTYRLIYVQIPLWLWNHGLHYGTCVHAFLELE